MWLVLLCSIASAGDFDGTYVGSGLTLTLVDDGSGGYAGSATLEGTTGRVSAQSSVGGLSGVAFFGGEVVPFAGTRQGSGLVIQSEGGVWQVARQGGDGPSAPNQATPKALVTTAYATLTPDASDAFHEALLFCLTFAGAAQADKNAVTRARVRQELTASFATLTPQDQVTIGNARSIWTHTQERWAAMGIEGRREFARGVLTLAFGEQASAYGVPTTPSAGDSSGSIDVDYLVGPIAGSDCWESAGCNYNEGTDTYEYQD